MKVHHGSKRFLHNADSKSFTAEASDISHGGHRQMFGRIYNDACDEGFTMVSNKTGQESVWYLSKEERDGDGELQFWELLPTPETLRKIPALNGYKTIIFND